MKKALIYGLSAALLLVSLTACHKPQADQQTDQSEPPQAATSTPATEPTSTPEPPAQNTSEPQKPTPEVTEPVEVKEDEPDEVEPVAETTPPQEPTPTENKPSTGGGGTTTTPPTSNGGTVSDAEIQAQIEAAIKQAQEGVANGEVSAGGEVTQGGIDYIGNKLGGGTTQTPKPSTGGGGTGTTQQTPASSTQQGGTVWDQAFYDTLTPQQQEMYKNADDSTRRQMKSFIEQDRELAAQGYQGNEVTDPEDIRETWSHITVGG